VPARPDPAGREAEKVQFQYAIVRVVPRVERGETLNAGVIVLSRPRRFLGARVSLDEARLRAIAPTRIPRRSCRTSPRSSGSRRATRRPGPSPSSRSRSGSTGSTAPSSTVIQPSEVHTGLCEDPAAELDHLFERLVR
jgi:hypothetical protein